MDDVKELRASDKQSYCLHILWYILRLVSCTVKFLF